MNEDHARSVWIARNQFTVYCPMCERVVNNGEVYNGKYAADFASARHMDLEHDEGHHG